MIQELSPSLIEKKQVKSIAGKPDRSQPSSSDTPQHQFTARWIDSVDELESLQAEWERLMESAIHRNLLFDPDFLIPAFKHFGDKSVRILVIEAPRKNKPKAPPVICGLLPLQTKRIYGMPLSGLEIWSPEPGVDTTPLLRSDCAKEVLNHIFDFLAVEEKTGLLSLDTIANFGEFANALTEVLHARQVNAFHRQSFARACFQPEADAETYFERHVSGGVKRTQRRLNRRLEEAGDVSVVCYRDAAISKTVTEDFLTLDASGWKLAAGTSITSNPRTESFFREMVQRSMRNNKLSFVTLKLAGRPISMLCDFYSGGIGYAYKTAFDHSMKEYSPGSMVELKNIEYLHTTAVTRVDSCSAPDNETINRIWGGRLRFQSLVIPLSGKTSRWAVAIMPLMQKLKEFRK